MNWPISDYTANLVLWALVFGLAAGWQAVTLWHRPRLPSFGDLVFALQRWRLLRLMLFAGWVWLGWHVFIRGDW